MTLTDLPKFWFARLYVTLHIGVIALVACFGEDTLLYKTVKESGDAGFWCVLALAAVSFLGVLDVIINDLMPDRFKLSKVLRFRHILLMAMALGLMSLGSVIAKQAGISTLHASIFLAVGGACWLAFLDLYARHRA